LQRAACIESIAVKKKTRHSNLSAPVTGKRAGWTLAGGGHK
jgi:hypothetical protein